MNSNTRTILTPNFPVVDRDGLLNACVAGGKEVVFTRVRQDGTYEGAYRLLPPATDRTADPRVWVYAVDATPAYLDARQTYFHWTAADDHMFPLAAPGERCLQFALFDGQSKASRYAILSRSEDGLLWLTEAGPTRAGPRKPTRQRPLAVSVQSVGAKIESFQRPNPREIISLRVKLRIEGSGKFNLREVMSEYLGSLTAQTYLAQTGLSPILFRDFAEFQGFFRDMDGPHHLTLDSAQLTHRYARDYRPVLSVTQRWGAAHSIFVANEYEGQPDGEHRMTLADETDKLVLQLRLNVLTGDTSMHYFHGVSVTAKDRMSVVDIEFTLRDPRQRPILDDNPDSHIKASVLASA